MKAVVINRFGDPDVFEFTEVNTPVIKENELLIEVNGGSLNPIDWKQRRGNHRFIFGADFPIILGYDVSGVVVKTGNKIKNFTAGDKVCGVLNNSYGGGLGKYAKGEEKCFTHVPDSLPLTDLAVLPLAGLTALQVLRDKAQLSKGKKLLLIGAAGGVGHYALQIASIYGADIHAVCSDSHSKFIHRLVNCRIIDYKKIDISRLSERFDIIFDAIGSYSFPKFKHLLRPGGIHVNILPRPKIILYKFLSLFSNGKKSRTHLMQHKPADLELLVKWVVEGKLKICIDKEFPWKQISDAHAYMEKGHTEGKILIRY